MISKKKGLKNKYLLSLFLLFINPLIAFSSNIENLQDIRGFKDLHSLNIQSIDINEHYQIMRELRVIKDKFEGEELASFISGLRKKYENKLYISYFKNGVLEQDDKGIYWVTKLGYGTFLYDIIADPHSDKVLYQLFKKETISSTGQ